MTDSKIKENNISNQMKIVSILELSSLIQTL